MDLRKNPTETIRKAIEDFVAAYRFDHETITAWEKPVVGFANGGDPLFRELKTIVGPTHALPEELVPGARTVIAYFVPFTKAVADANREGDVSTIPWDRAYLETNRMLVELNEHLYKLLSAQGFQASRLPATFNYDKEKLRSDWSHRSAAYIAGVGTFGVNNMLITRAGCCGRVGSVITDLPIAPTPRPEEEYCLFKQNGTCGKCMERCPVKSFSVEDGQVIFHRFTCGAHVDKHARTYPDGDADTCGKCMCAMPCSFRIPGKLKK